MLVTLTYFANLAKNDRQQDVPVGAGYRGSQQVTADGDSNAAPEAAKWVKVATDTAITIDAYGEDAGEEGLVMPGFDFFPCRAGQVHTIATV